IYERNDLYSVGQYMIVEFLHLLMERRQRRFGVGAFPQKDDPRNDVAVVCDCAVIMANRPAELPEPYLRPLRNLGDILDAARRAVFSEEHRVLDITHVSDLSYLANVDLLHAALDKAPARVDVAAGNLLLHLRETYAV